MEHPQEIDARKCEPEAAASKDTARPVLQEPWLQGDHLYATDSYVAVRIPVKRDEHDVDGVVPGIALKAARSNKSFQHVLLENGSAIAVGRDGKLEIPRGEDLEFPQVDQLIPDAQPGPMRFGIDLAKLANVGKALGTNVVEISFDPEQVLGPIMVRPAGGRHRAPRGDGRIGLIMPVKLHGEAS